MRTILICLALLACTPAKAPTAVDVATLAINAVDTALAAAISSEPLDAGPTDAVWEQRVQAVEKAAAVVKAAGDVCGAMPDLEAVAVALDCAKCKAAISVALTELKCP